MNFLNYGAYHAVLAWIILVLVLVMHSMALISEIKENFQNVAVTIYYVLMFLWFAGILFFYFFNAYN
jgi:hypothetical protein